MVIRSPGNQSGRALEELKLPGRAVAALMRAGITDVAGLAGLTRRELSAVPGLGPSTIAAIRAVVPEPPARLPRSGAEPSTPSAAQTVLPEAPPAEEESPTAPAIPSFASLRDPRRRTPLDLLVPEQPPAAPEPAAPESQPEPEESAPPASPAGAPRPAEWGDLWRFGLRAARWWVAQPVRTVRRLLG
ncbi:DNA-directed RNA polymerase subunit alpha C-terminal domain-containing protein [Geodermatophilus sp. URMC 62]|uniref:DNA-directed RNA polymerase subunit alpha C-terminal domain-containing protein n=1 Tax=Geodermatophilus sp. URMC 62 TaxID=3423414 RepID=UPI00406D1F1A